MACAVDGLTAVSQEVTLGGYLAVALFSVHTQVPLDPLSFYIFSLVGRFFTAAGM